MTTPIGSWRWTDASFAYSDSATDLARAKARVSRNGFLDDKMIVGAQTELAPHAFQVTARALVIGAFDLRMRRRLDRYRRAQFVERQSDAAEPTPQSAVQIHEAEVQPRRNRYRHAVGDGSRTAHAGSDVFRAAGLSRALDRFRLDAPPLAIVR